MKKKAIIRIFQETNKRNLTPGDLDMVKKGEILREKLNFFE